MVAVVALAFAVYWFWPKASAPEQVKEQPKQTALKEFNGEKLGYIIFVPEGWTQTATDKAEWTDPAGQAKMTVATSDLTADFLSLLPVGYVVKDQKQFTLNSGSGMRYYVQVPAKTGAANQTVSEQLSLITSSLTKTINVSLTFPGVMPAELAAIFDDSVKTLASKDMPLDLSIKLTDPVADVARLFFKHISAKEFTEAVALFNPALFKDEAAKTSFLDSLKVITSLNVFSILPNQKEVWPTGQNEYRIIFDSKSSDAKLWPEGLQARFMSMGEEAKTKAMMVGYFAGAPRFYPNQTISIFFPDNTRVKAKMIPLETEAKRETNGVHPWQTILANIFNGPTAAEKKVGLFTETNGEKNASLGFDPQSGVMTINLTGKCVASVGYNLGDLLLKNFGQFVEVKKLRVLDENGQTEWSDTDSRNSFPVCFASAVPAK